MLQNLDAVEEFVVCLYDGEYHFGVAALANSLVNSNFKGVINIGYRGILPPWVSQLKLISDCLYYLNNDVIIHFELLTTEMHLAFYKPYFIKQTFDNFPSAKKVFYFDVDIVVNASWSFFTNWLQGEVCLCLDNSFEFVHRNHPWRRDWKKLAGIESVFANPLTLYVNSGFIGISRPSINLINKWIELSETFARTGGDLKIINQDGESSFKGDQDLLNAAVTACPEIELSVIGKEGMGFTQPAYLMSHSVAKAKPWSKDFMIYLIRKGHKPNHSEKNFFKYCHKPIQLFSKFEFFKKKVNLVFATFFGRYIGY